MKEWVGKGLVGGSVSDGRDGWMDSWVKVWVREWAGGWMDGWMNMWVSGWMAGCVDESVAVWVKNTKLFRITLQFQ